MILRQLSILGFSCLLLACGSPYRAPVDELGGEPRFLNAGRTHRVNAGETLYAVAWMYDLDYLALARANQLREPYNLTQGQELLIDLRNLEGVRAGGANAVTTAAAPGQPVTTGVSIARNTSRTRLPSPESSRAGTAAASPRQEAAPAPVLARTPAPAPVPEVTREAVVEKAPEPVRQESGAEVNDSGVIAWSWPADGTVIGRYSERSADSRGLDIGGRRGDTVKAAADGEVVYAGSGLLRYGELVIIKHNTRYLSAYAHNERILVDEGQRVVRGQQIAELGSSGIDKLMLHFEIRVDGSPVDPLLYLPER